MTRFLLAILALCLALAVLTRWQENHPLSSPGADDAAPMVYGGL